MDVHGGEPATCECDAMTLSRKADTATAVAFLNPLVEAIPYQINAILTDNGSNFPICRKTAKALRNAARPPLLAGL
jgi:hypothetical protein